MEQLDGRVALVTGASRGIGAAVSRALDGAGVRLALASRSGSNLGIEGAVAMPTDVRDPASLEAIVAATIERFGGLDIVVVNAGVGAYGPFLELPADQLEEMIDVNVKGALYTVRAALPHLLRSDAPDLVTIASEAGRRGLPNEATYCASKFAQVGLTRALDHELREQGVRCTNVCPGGVATDFAMGRGRTPEMPALAGMMHAEDVAEIVMFVLTRPRNHRILEVALRPVTETSWG
jgi:NADP-dependent 3-hydroxy acid dehydrogenase YdfG